MELLRADGGHVGGVLLLDVRRGTFVAVRSRAILLAMGGGPTMYKVIACSADKSSDGIALGLHAGVRLRDMEMVQFHPTGLIVPNSLMTGALLEEGLRGAGGRLLNGRGERFMQRYDARAPRAVHPRPGGARLLHRGAGRPRHRQRRRVDRRLAPGRRGGGEELPRHGAALPRLRPRPRARAGRGGADRPLHDGRHRDRPRLPHRRGGPLRGRRGHRRRARRQPARRQRGRGVHRVRRHRGRRDGGVGGRAPAARSSRARTWTRPPRPPARRSRAARAREPLRPAGAAPRRSCGTTWG